MQHVSVHGKRCMTLSKRKSFLIPSCRMWTLEYLTTQTVIVLPPNMDSSSFGRHHTWQAGLSQIGAKTDMTLFLASTIQFCTKLYYIITILLLEIQNSFLNMYKSISDT